DPAGVGAGDYPLLTLPEQRQARHSLSSRNSPQIDRRGSNDNRISLPRSLRHSFDDKGLPSPSLHPGDAEFGLFRGARGYSTSPRTDRRSFCSVNPPVEEEEGVPEPISSKTLDKGKGRAIMADTMGASRVPHPGDLERGPDILDPRRHSQLSTGEGIGSALSSTNSSIMGEEVQPDGEEWGPQHPCYPHLNPHVPVDSPEYQTTRIIRVRRDWLMEGDLAPTFADLYPEILDPAGLSEQEFRRVIEKLNSELVPIFSPYNWRNIVDAMLGLATGWLWDDFGLTAVKSRLQALEDWIDQWNREAAKTVGSDEGAIPPKIIPLRRTGYMTLDIQISDPKVAPVPSTPGASRSGPPEEPDLPAATS
ncbi:hypothetical protein ACRALDRAFT_2109845, partial [Sodiomyces alcalophilus JCM 7366]|uniref:uncharacterized protein n=1 Tax=Sodiomyces alcalophilus JCM 7366 TaxID=591952 RepID=UPI0039B62745